MAKKRTKADRLERQTEQLEKREDRQPDEIEKKKPAREDVNQTAAQTPLAPKSDEPTVLIPIEQQIQQRAPASTRQGVLGHQTLDRTARNLPGCPF